MLGVPIGYAVIKYSFIQAPTNDTPVGKFGLAAFIVLVLVGQFVIDLIKHYIEQYKLSNKLAFMKNHAITYIFLGAIMLLANYIAWDAFVFCLWAGGSSLLAYIPAFIEKHYYKLWKAQ